MTPLVYPNHPVFADMADALAFIAVPDERLLGWGGAPFHHVPPVDEEYFEWVDLADALRTARGRFVMIELGAGYGRWSLRAGHMAKRLGKRDVTIRLLEAEPQHAQWAREAIVANGLSEFDMTVIEAAISYDGGPARFYVSFQELAAANWYGQRIDSNDGSRPTAEQYCGKTVFKNPRGDRLIDVDTVTLEEIIVDLPLIDFLDMDLQGLEKSVIERSIHSLNAKVRRVHVGTHGTEIEDAIRKIFIDAKWRGVWDFSCGVNYITPYGPVTFNDGVQSWINPRLESDIL